MVNVFCIFKVQVVHTSTSLRMQIINQHDNLLALVVDSTSLSGFNQHCIFLKDTFQKKSLKNNAGVFL